MNPFLPEEWRVESLRLTLFTTPEPVDTRGWWDSSVGQPALETASKKMGGETTSSGTLAGQALQLVVTPMRVDWLLTAPEPTAEDPPQTIPTIGPIRDALSEFGQLVHRWLDTAQPRARRLALGVVLLHPEPDADAAMRSLQAFLPVSLEAGPVSDFLFQINRRQASQTTPALELNRLSKWSRAMFQRVALQVTAASAGGGLSAAQMPIGASAYFSRLELDINTAQEFSGVLEASQLKAVFDELATNALEVAKVGIK